MTLASSSLVPKPPRLDPRYRDRGLLTTAEDGQDGRIRRPDVGGFARQVPDVRIQEQRPGFTDMVLRHREGDAARTPRSAGDGRARWSEPGARPEGVTRSRPGAAGTRQSPRDGSSAGRRPSPSESPRIERPHAAPRYEAPRNEAPRAEPAHAQPAPPSSPRVETKPAAPTVSP